MEAKSKKFVLMAGNIGSGKTSLTQLLGNEMGWQTAYESVADNPYIADFYADMKAWAFHLQVYFLGSRSAQHEHMSGSPVSAIIDRSIYEDAHIFVRALYELGNLSDRDYNAYKRLYQQVIDNLPKPDLLIHLKAPVPILMQRIRLRARNIEESVSQDYIELLERYYDEWIANFDVCPVLTVQSGDLDFVHKPEHLRQVISHINDRLFGRDQILLE